MDQLYVVFVNGCFWHHHDCPYFEWPKNNAEFWKKKIEGNVSRDRVELKKLEEMGWRVFVIWQCELERDPEAVLMELCSDIVYG